MSGLLLLYFTFMTDPKPKSVRIYRKWNKQKIIDEIKSIVSRKEPLNAGHINRKYIALYGAVCSKRYYKNWGKAVSAVGINYNEINLRKHRTTRDILDEIRKIFKNHGCLKTTLISRISPGLLLAVRKNRYLRKWKRAVEKAGYNYYKVTNVSRWDKGRILKEIRSICKKGFPLTDKYVSKYYPDLYRHAVNGSTFLSWDNAVVRAGIDRDKFKNEKLLDNTPFVDAAAIRSCSNESRIKEYFIEYLNYKRYVRKSSMLSNKNYLSLFGRFVRYVGRKGCVYIRHIDLPIIRAYFVYLRRGRRSPATVDISYYALRKFFDYCCRQKYISDNPIIKLGRPRLRKGISPILNEHECERIIKYSMSNYTSNEYIKTRNIVIICLFLLAGLSSREILELELRDLSFSNKTMVINRGNVRRIMPIADPLLKVLKRYLSFRSDSASIKLITTSVYSGPMSHNWLYYIVKRLLKGANIRKRINPLNLRFSFASILLNSGVSIIHLHKILGHRNISHTYSYNKYATKQIRNTLKYLED